jgi:hypothetical protein
MGRCESREEAMREVCRRGMKEMSARDERDMKMKSGGRQSVWGNKRSKWTLDLF